MGEGALAEVGHLEVVAQREVAVERDERVGVHQHGGDAADQHRGERHLGDRACPGVAAHQTIAAMLAMTSWIHEPAAVTQSRALSSGKVQAVVHVAEERRLEVDQHRPDLVHLAAEVLAGVAVAQLVDHDDERPGAPEDEQRARRSSGSGRDRSMACREVGPLDGQDEQVDGEQEDRRDEERAGEEEPEVRHRAIHEVVGVAHRPAEPEDVALEQAGAAAAGGAGRGAAPSAAPSARPRVRSSSPIALSFTAKRSSAAGGHPEPVRRQRRRRLLRRSCPVERLHHPDFDRPEPEVLPGLGVLHDEALLAAVGLLDEHQVGAELGRSAHGAARTTLSPAAIPRTTSTRSPGSSAPSDHGAERRAAVVPDQGVAVPGHRGPRDRHDPPPLGAELDGDAAAGREPRARGRAAAPARACRWPRRAPARPGSPGHGRWRRHPRGTRASAPTRMPLAAVSGTCTAASTGASAVTRKSESPGLTSRCDPGHASGDDAGEGRDDPGEVVVALRLPERQLGVAVLELDLLRVGLRDHAGRRERPLALDPLPGVGRLLPRLRQGDLLVGALQPRRAPVRRPPRSRCPRGSSPPRPDERASTAASCSTYSWDGSESGRSTVVLSAVDDGGAGRTPPRWPRRRSRRRAGCRGRRRRPAGRARRHVTGHDQILHQVSRAQRTGPRSSRVAAEAGSVSTRT